MAESIVETIIVKLGLDVSSYNPDTEKAIKKTDQMTGSMEKADKKTSAFGATLMRVFATSAILVGIGRMVDQIAKLNDELYHLEKNLGMSSQTIQAWQGAAGAMGGSADGMTNSMKSLNGAMNDFVMMGDTSMLPYMNALGVSMVDVNGKVRDTDKVMLDLADSFSKMDREQAFSLASKMGIDEGTFNTLVQGRKEMEKMIEYQKTMYRSSEAELQVSRDLQRNRALLGQHWESMKTMMANALMPLFLKASEILLGLFEYLQKHQKAVQAVFKGIAFVLTAILIPSLVKATLAALAFIAPFAPFILVVGALGAAFGLLYDDYKVWAEGGKSLFDWGLFSDYIDKAKSSTDNLAKAFRDMGEDLVKNTIPTLRGYADIISKLKSGDIAGAASLASEMVSNFSDRVLGYVDTAMGQEQGTASNAVGVAVAGLVGMVGGVAGSSTSDKKLEAKGGTGKKQEFVKKYLPVAQEVGSRLGVPPEALLGQWALETNWGKAITKGTGYNLGNIKAGSSWKGKTVKAYDKAEKSYDPYRVYETPEQFADDYVGLIQRRKAYKGAIGAKTPEEYFTALKKGGYATDPVYVKSGVATTKSVMAELNVSSANQSMRQSNYINMSGVNSNKAIADRSNKVDVKIDNVNVNTSADTLKSTATAGLQAAANQIMSILPASQ